MMYICNMALANDFAVGLLFLWLNDLIVVKCNVLVTHLLLSSPVCLPLLRQSQTSNISFPWKISLRDPSDAVYSIFRVKAPSFSVTLRVSLIFFCSFSYLSCVILSCLGFVLSLEIRIKQESRALLRSSIPCFGKQIYCVFWKRVPDG